LGRSTDDLPCLLLSYKVSDAGNCFPDDKINVEEFIGIKSYKAKGKRLSTREIESFQFLEPFEPDPTEEEPSEPEVPENEERIEVNPADVPFEIVKPQDEEPKGEGVQMDLFGNDL
jgi:topoisomerase-4 subunit A